MNKELFIQYLHNPTKLEENSIANLADIVNEYPYFQTAQLLYLKSLHDNKSIRYPAQLKIVAAYAGDRSILFRLIKQQHPKPSAIVIPQPVAPIEEIVTLKIEEPGVESQRMTQSDDLMDFDFDIEQETIRTPHKSPEIQPQLLDYTHNLAKKPPIVSTETEGEIKPKRTAQLIDAFIEKSPRIVPRVPMEEQLPQQEDISTYSVEENDFMTETLADIYIRQKNYAKAANIYQRLILIYPQKSIYFAQKLEQLKELSIQ